MYEVLNEGDCTRLATELRTAEWSEGRARTKALTGTVKQNQEILEHAFRQQIEQRLLKHSGIQIDHIPKTCYLKLSRYETGQHYKLHTDAPWMGEVRTDLSCTLWLNDDYEGGELVVDGVAYKGRAGQALVYDCGLPHEVRPVTKGERLCAVAWLQSRIRDPIRRKLISDYRRFISKLEGTPLFVEAGRFNSALLRLWSE